MDKYEDSSVSHRTRCRCFVSHRHPTPHSLSLSQLLLRLSTDVPADDVDQCARLSVRTAEKIRVD
jgi:hypothetical protein